MRIDTEANRHSCQHEP